MVGLWKYGLCGEYKIAGIDIKIKLWSIWLIWIAQINDNITDNPSGSN